MFYVDYQIPLKLIAASNGLSHVKKKYPFRRVAFWLGTAAALVSWHSCDAVRSAPVIGAARYLDLTECFSK